MATGKTNAAGGKGFKYGEMVTLSDLTLDRIKRHGGDHQSFNFNQFDSQFLVRPSGGNRSFYGKMLYDQKRNKYYYPNLVDKGSSRYAIELCVFDGNLNLVSTKEFSGTSYLSVYAIDFDNFNMYTPNVFLNTISGWAKTLGNNNNNSISVSYDDHFVFITDRYTWLKVYDKSNFSLVRSIDLTSSNIRGLNYVASFDLANNIICVVYGNRIRYVNLNTNVVLNDINYGYSSAGYSPNYNYDGYFSDLNCCVFEYRDGSKKNGVIAFNTKEKKAVFVGEHASPDGQYTTYRKDICKNLIFTYFARNNEVRFKSFCYVNGVKNVYDFDNSQNKVGRYTRNKTSTTPLLPSHGSSFVKNGRYYSQQIGGSIILSNEVVWYEND